jgi:poly-gamma-glutamate capsule biosynthesis protein CapA/YwtB (metallophosphatase superfamily)
MTRREKADDYLDVLEAAIAYRDGDKIYARVVLARLDDPLEDAMRIIGVMLSALQNEAIRHDVTAD